MLPSKKEGQINLHIPVGQSVGMSEVGLYVGLQHLVKQMSKTIIYRNVMYIVIDEKMIHLACLADI